MVVEQLPRVSLLNLYELCCYDIAHLLYCMKWLGDCGSKIASLGVFDGRVPNHVLVNEYAPSQGIMVRVEAVERRTIHSPVISHPSNCSLMRTDHCTLQS